MNVAILLLEDFPGSDNRVQRECRSLVGAGHSVWVYCATGPSTQAEWEGVQIVRAPVLRKKAGGLRTRLGEYLRFQFHSWRWLRDSGGDLDVVQIANPPDWLVFSALGWKKRRTGRRIILDLHEPMPELMAAKRGGGVPAAVLRWLQGVSCRRADETVVVTRAFGERLESTHGFTAHLVRNGVDTAAFPFEPPRAGWGDGRAIRLVYVGTVADRFGVDVASNAVSMLVEQDVDVVLDVYGDGVGMADLRVAAQKHPVRVRLHGQVPSSSVVDVLRQADIGLVPYRRSPFMDLAESTKGFEYAALGLPIVCSDIPALRGQFGDEAAWYASPGDAADLARVLKAAIANPEEALRRAETAQTAAHDAQWARIEPAYLRVVTGERGTSCECPA